jgi:hypothetical protein
MSNPLQTTGLLEFTPEILKEIWFPLTDLPLKVFISPAAEPKVTGFPPSAMAWNTALWPFFR